MKRSIKIIRHTGILIAALFGLAAASPDSPVTSGGKAVLAVYPMDTRSVDRNLSGMLTTLVRAELVKSDKISVISEELFFDLIKKQALQSTAFYDQRDTQMQLGRMVKAEKLVLSRLGRLNYKYVLFIEVVDLETGQTDFIAKVEGDDHNNDHPAMASAAGMMLRNYYDPLPPGARPKGHVEIPEPPDLPAPAGVSISKKPALELKGHKYNVHCLAYSPDGKLLFSGATDSTIRVWDADTGEKLRVLRSHSETVLSLDISPDGKLLASGSRDDSVVIWDLETFLPVTQISGLHSDVYGVAFAPDGERLAAAAGTTLHMYELKDEDWKEIWHNYWGDQLLSLDYAQDGSVVAVGSEHGKIFIANADNGKLKKKVDRGERMREVRCLSYEPYNRYMASGSDDDLVHLWNGKGVEMARMGGHLGDVNAVAFTYGGRVLFSAGNDNMMRAWTPEGEMFAERKAGKADLLAMAVRPGNGQVAVAGRDGKVRVWNVSIEEK